jgi:hypothetical protein
MVMTMRSRRMAAVAAACAVLALSGCGVPLEDAAQPLPSDVVGLPTAAPSPTESGAASPTATPAGSPSPSALIEIISTFFVRDDGLVAVDTEVSAPLFAESVVDALVTGPVGEAGLRSVAVDPLTGSPLIAIGSVGPEQTPDASVTVVLSPKFGALPPTEQVLLLGQVVLSLSSAGWPSVSFVDALGAPVAVPLPDGRLLDRPAGAGDYASLIVAL